MKFAALTCLLATSVSASEMPCSLNENGLYDCQLSPAVKSALAQIDAPGTCEADDEMEYVICYDDDITDFLKHGLRSTKAQKKVSMDVWNHSGKTAEMWWVNYGGKLASYGTVKPGAKWNVMTFASHPWVVTVDGEKIGLVVVEDTDAVKKQTFFLKDGPEDSVVFL